MNKLDLTVNTSMLIEQLVECASERGILIGDSASLEELASAQSRIDKLTEELFRRMAW
jgi:hypothetical protein